MKKPRIKINQITPKLIGRTFRVRKSHRGSITYIQFTIIALEPRKTPFGRDSRVDFRLGTMSDVCIYRGRRIKSNSNNKFYAVKQLIIDKVQVVLESYFNLKIRNIYHHLSGHGVRKKHLDEKKNKI